MKRIFIKPHERKTHDIWEAMLKRCRDKKRKYYGARGISFCKRWEKFKNFYVDMGKRPFGKQLDRINNNGNYEPSNCRWTTKEINQRNKNNNRRILWCGKNKCVADWADITGISSHSILSRLNAGWPIERTLTEKRYINKIKNNKLNRFMGARRHGKKWYSMIGIDGKRKYLGTYETRREAADVYYSERERIDREKGKIL